MLETKPETEKTLADGSLEDVRVSDIFAGMPDDGYFRQFARCAVPQRKARDTAPPKGDDRPTPATIDKA